MCKNEKNIYKNMVVITNRKLVDGDLTDQVAKIAKLRPGGLILREKDLSDAEYRRLAIPIRQICLESDIDFYIHSRFRVAAEIGCENLHVSISALREIPKDQKIRSLCVSCHSPEDVQTAIKYKASRIVLGTIFETDCKPGLAGRGIAFVREICQQCPIPVYAIGGVKESNLPLLMEAGASGGCMMSGFMQL